MDVEKEDLLRAVKKQGFALEYQTASIFEKVFPGGETEQSVHIVSSNHLLNMQGATQPTIEIDVICNDKDELLETVYLVECKGTNSENGLFLIEAPKKKSSVYPELIINGQHIGHIFQQSVQIKDNFGGHRVCSTGDFFNFTNKGKDLQKVSKHEESSNFFKGITQLNMGVQEYFETKAGEVHGDIPFLLVPILVTNCEIAIVQYLSGGKVDVKEPKVVRNVRWCLYDNNYVFTHSKVGERPWLTFGANASILRDQGRDKRSRFQFNHPYFWVVDVKYLEEFLVSKDKAYSPEELA